MQLSYNIAADASLLACMYAYYSSHVYIYKINTTG